MEYDFSFQNPTRIHFGKHALEYLEPELNRFGPRVLLVYGGGSVKQTGLYETTLKLLKRSRKKISELSGVPSNPTASKVYEGISLAKKFEPDLILAVGGGSVIDCAKAVAAGALTHQDFWETFFLRKEKPMDAIPIGVILTMAGTGSEMNGGSVITHEESKRKTSMESGLLYPIFSILNPELTYTVPKEQMISGICDIISHILEVYMSPSDEDNLSDDLAEAILGNVIRSARRALKDPKDYTARSNLMWGATLGLNGLLEGSKRQDWMVHQIEHQIGAYTNCPHGLGLSAISANYYRLVCPHAEGRFFRFATNVWNIDLKGKTQTEVARLGIDALEAFFREMGACTSLRELGMDETSPIDEIANSCKRLRGGYLNFTHEQICKLLWDSL
ncbi:MAG: Fe-dependent oxidoreductase, alcohol dehydrogenase [Evtepia sp.]|jgi:alcohol dehydrogenase YqhD (iron-dependent ADH family)|nr:Fe-dependent oxidoreductase, alcohol dehydrogenase [Evtepia sp.]